MKDCDVIRIDTVNAFRLGMEAQGNSLLGQLMECISPLLENNALILGQPEAELFENIFTAQQKSDFIYLADLLQYEWSKTNLNNL